MDGTQRNDHPRPTETIVFGHDYQIEFGMADLGVLDLRGNGMPTTGAPDCQRRHRCVSSASDHQIGPGWVQARTAASGGTERQKPELRRQTNPREADDKALLDEREPSCFS
jgi:hypothetical protein